MSNLKDTKLATTVTVSSNYAGRESADIIGAAWRESDTLKNNLLTTAENVNYELNLRKIELASGVRDYSCGHVPAGAITLSEKVVAPKKLKNDFDVCKEDFRQTWSDPSMGGAPSNPNAPSDIMEAISMQVLEEQGELIDNLIWQGVNATAGQFGGFIPQFVADGDVIKPAQEGTPAPIDEANVEAELKKVLNAIPIAIRRGDITIAVSPDVFQAYTFMLISKGIAWNGTADDKQAKYGKYTLSEVGGLPDNTIIAFEKKNLVFATGLLNTSLELTDEDSIGLQTGLVRGSLVFNGGTGYYNSAEVVYYVSVDA